jgi:hypothetical protein
MNIQRQRKRFATGAMAAALCMAATGWAAMDADLPPEQIQGKVTYLSGGIGLDQQAAIKRAASEYPLELEFLESGEPHAVFAAGVQVTITDRMGKVVLDARSDGPFLLARLPDGQYTIRADNTGKVETRQVSIEQGRHKTVVFDWRA